MPITRHACSRKKGVSRMDEMIPQLVAAVKASLDADAPDLNPGAAELLRHTDRLCALCELCFWASLEKEERREVRGTLVLCSPDRTLPAKAFATPVPVTVPNLVALLIASPRTPLAVHDGPGGLSIWGLLDSEPASLPRLRIAGNGTLLASCRHRVLALLHRGAVSVPVAADEASLEHLVAGALGKEQTLEARGSVPAKLIRVGTTMIRHGHGGTLVLVPPADQSWRQAVRFRFNFDPLSDPVSALCEQCGPANSPRASHTSLQRRVGDLSLIDGAVVMDLDLRLLGFGAKLLFGLEDFLVTTLNAVTGEKSERVPLAELGGMRHQSAARFIHDNRSAEVFVVSQDGRLTMFSWSESTHCVVVIQKLEHFIWEYERND